MLITNADVVDVETETIHPRQAIAIRGGRIDRISPSPAESCAKALDAEGAYVCPILVLQKGNRLRSSRRSHRRGLTAGLQFLAVLSLLCVFRLDAQSLPGADALRTRDSVRKALDYIRDHQQAQIDKQIEIAQIPASPFHEEVRGKALEKEFRRVHLQDVEIDPAGNVLGWRKGKSPRTFVIAAHLDTVFPPGTDFTVKRVGTRLNGPGLVDDTRGLTALLAMAEALDATGITTGRSLLFVANVGEEGLGDLRGGKYLLHEGKYRDLVDGFISIDGEGSNRIVTREMGSRRYRVTVTGPGGHSYLNFGRANPAHALGRIIAHLADMEVPTTPKTTYNVGRIGGGTSVNSIPFESWMEFDMRSEEEGPLIRLEEEFLRRAQMGVDEENRARAGSGTSVKLDARRVAIRHAVSNPVNESLVQTAKWAAVAAGVGVPGTYTGSSDTNTPLAMGIPAITIDGGGKAGNLHSLEEWFEPADAYKGIQKVLLTVLAYDEVFPSLSRARQP